MRAAVTVRPATEDDLLEVAELAASVAPDGTTTAAADPGRLCEHLSVLLAAGGEVLVAVEDGAVVGFLLVRVLGPRFYALTPSLYVDAILVAPRTRRHGVGRSLLVAALDLAAEAGAENIYCAPAPGAREMHRFLARLGFAPAAGHRVVAVPVLERRLAQGASPGATVVRRRDGGRRRRDATRAAIEDLVARRRRAREAGLPTGPVDLRAFQVEHAAAEAAHRAGTEAEQTSNAS
ncbi:L-amino acid N-acyltransferase YncA [Isoptericola sp. CG 20/1183]|uniref:L-amino acid N-acyltransferase YncA n=1 Tax=Isoptericola halotolerans TaxID=300560 RepID=A0ABX5EA86_9MICO|nr:MULTISPECIES: GNAT family N-acetyltransferase [Isoptericola]MCK0115783.1 GNAT family N-acetyltransferase [Isoptericola sp. S6320L]PRZ03458.1 L-amino acid N-acyltransferase YncA [Isoptericola sp. CG 20/1183]PRZ03745.1 L-amino acid N-acyltransferase YncA [Isoptericola halotolerans]